MSVDADSVNPDNGNEECQTSSVNEIETTESEFSERMSVEENNAESKPTNEKHLCDEEKEKEKECLHQTVETPLCRVFLLLQLNKSNDVFGIPRLTAFDNRGSSLKTGKEILLQVLETVIPFFESSALKKIKQLIQSLLFCILSLIFFILFISL